MTKPYQQEQKEETMKKTGVILTIGLIFALASFAQAEDVQVSFPIKNALDNPKVSAKLNYVKLFWGNQGYSEVKTDFGEFKTSQRTNAFMKGREEACQWALTSALIELQNRAVKEGGNAVVNIKSNIKNVEVSSEEDYECLAGSMMVNVALKGNVVRLAD